MAEFKITRFRYTWTGPWSASSVDYKRDDVVYHQGSAWVCVRQHTSAVFDDAQTYIPSGETLPSPAWVKMSDGRQWNGAWQSAQRYDIGAIVVAGGNLYLCAANHLSSTNFSDDLINWEVLAVGSNFRDTWDSAQRYKVGDIVRYNGYTYVCTVEHTSGSVLTEADWDTVVENYQYVGEWDQTIVYRKNDLVKYGGSILKCTADHTSTSSIDNTKFVTYLPGFNYLNDWSSNTFYAIGDVVKRGGNLYIAVQNNVGSQPGVSNTYPAGNVNNWVILDKAQAYKGDYDPQRSVNYEHGDLVRRGGSLWISLTDQTSDDSTLAAFDTSNWELVISAYNFTGAWHSGADYNNYDVVYYRGVAYYCNTPHHSSLQDFPGDNGEGFSYWTVIAIGNENSALNSLGDLVTYNLYRNVIQDGSTMVDLGDGSTYGATAVQIGERDQLLTVQNNNGDLYYNTWGTLQRVFFVRKDGVDDIDDPHRGHNYFKPWKTIRFALERADDDYEGFTTILVSTGLYEEILPLIVPARTAVVGEELRSVTVQANSPIPILGRDSGYTINALIKVGSMWNNLLLGNTITKSPGNTEIQNTSFSVTSTEFALVDEIWSAGITMIDSRVNNSGSEPVVTGSNVQTTNTRAITAIQIIELNREFIKAEVIAYMAVTYPEYTFDQTTCLRDLDKFIDALQYDLRYTGNYKSVLAGRYYANAVTGSAGEDMFYVRDTTGIRNMTLKGLEGTLPPLTEGEFYRIPSGGAFVSLDPGWGPNDERTWITNRSCYVQNVTTFGVGAIGQKVDGTVHNGGNKSIVSNDFTQIISDGIGAWVSNGGRVELVSVFTYYAHIGMFAQHGGIIRATNGNNSYGEFGSVADGIDPLEQVRYGYVNTQTEQAVVAAAFAGEVLDYILALEFKNCGQNYTQASYTVNSSGAGAVAAQEEFRDNSMFECQTLSTGSGFNQYGNQAQYGNETAITLATAETATEEQILGMRIIIISGEGTGQYAVVNTYSSTTKLCTVVKESDGTPGWDHVLPGTPSKSLLTTGTRYRIEPRVIFDAPPYSAQQVDFVTGTGSYEIAAGAYGETSEVFTNISGTAGTGTTVDVVPVAAEFTVTKVARTYTLTLSDGGSGYSVGDTITINGSQVGGIDVENNIVVTVTSISNDSTNSVLTFEHKGVAIADSGKFILTPYNSDTGILSSDGLNWTQVILPRSGNWIDIAAGDNRFVAILNSSNSSAYSTNGEDWTYVALPANRDWRAVTYGKPQGVDVGIFVTVSGTLNTGAYSIDGGENWLSTTLPTAGDSTLCEWTDIAFGAGKFVALANEQNIVAVGTWDGVDLTWAPAIMDVVADSSRKQWVSIAYGNRRFVAISDTGDVGYSFDGLVWYSATMPTADGSTIHRWRKISYGQGVFFAVGDTAGRDVAAEPTTGPTTFAATSYDGIVWENKELASEQNWSVAVFGNPDVTLGDSTVSNSKPTWVIASTTSSTFLNVVYTGARALGRAVVSGQGISYIKIWEPGSGYVDLPTLTVYAPNASAPTFRTRMADGVLCQPTWLTKGSAYKTSTTYVTVSGDGFADKTPEGKYITIDGLSVLPGPGAQLYIAGREDFFVAVEVGIDQVDMPDGTIRSTFQVSPRPTLAKFLEHGMEVLIREKYSQVRITGHDFLDIGAGNFEDTNYPRLYDNYDYTIDPFKEVFNLNGGRVFYTSTDQSGNFRAGKLFAVEQATGIITISADFFDLAGLTELRLAGVTVGSTAVIREFSKDPLFLQNSNSVIPTQRAVRSYLQSRLNIGGEDLLTPSIIAGVVKIGPAEINNSAGLTIDVNVMADFYGSTAGIVNGISGSILAQTMFARSFNNSSR